MPRGEVGRVAARLVAQFARGGESGATTPPDYIENCVITSVGRDGPTRVCAWPRSTDNWLTKGDLVLGGHYSARRRFVAIEVNRDQCASPKRWAGEIRATLRHELTHAADPYVHVRNTPYARPGTVVKKAPRVEHPLLEPHACGYYLDPVEVTARLAQVEEQLLAAETRRTIRRDVRKGFIKPGQLASILLESPAYLTAAHCLAKVPKIHRRFRQLAARLWRSGKLGPPPR